MSVIAYSQRLGFSCGATLLKTLKMQPREAMEILGHSRIAVALEVYTDGDQDSRREAIGRIGRLLESGAS